MQAECGTVSRRVRWHSLLSALLLVAVLVACGPKSVNEPPEEETPDPTTTGSISIVINGLTGGADADVTVTGPESFSAEVTATRKLKGLEPGTYTVTATAVAGYDLIGSAVQSAEVTAGVVTDVTVTYAAASLSVSSTSADPQLPLQTTRTLQFDIVRGGEFAGEVAYTVVGADGFAGETWNGDVAAADSSFDILVADDGIISPGTHTLTVTVSGTLHGHPLTETIEVEVEVAAEVSEGSDHATSPAPGSLRALLADPRTTGGTISLAEELLAAAPFSITLADSLEFTEDVSIAGPAGWSANPGPSVYLSGNDAFTPVIVSNGASVTLANLQVHEGNTATNGGGIQVEAGSSLTLDGVYVHDNDAAVNGGGIWNQGTLYIQNNSRIFDNVAARGGGVWSSHADAVAILEDSIVSLNNATVSGGGFYLKEGRLTLRGMAVRLNAAAENGGGVMADNNGWAFERAWLEILDGTEITSNRALDGGGVYSYAETTIADSFVHMNSAANQDPNPTLGSGGGIRNHLRMVITNTEITENSAGADYGGVFNDGIMTISDSRVLDNAAGGNGGGVFSGVIRWDDLNGEPKRLLIERSQVAGNTAGVNGGHGQWRRCAQSR